MFACVLERDEIIAYFSMPTVSSDLTKIKANSWSACPRSVMVKGMHSGIVVSVFELQLPYYVHFRTNTLEKDMNTLIFPDMGLILPQVFF